MYIIAPRHVANKFIISFKLIECKNFFKPLINENTKIQTSF